MRKQYRFPTENAEYSYKIKWQYEVVYESQEVDSEYQLKLDIDNTINAHNKTEFIDALHSVISGRARLALNEYEKNGNIFELKQNFHVIALLQSLGRSKAKNQHRYMFTKANFSNPLYAVMSDSNKAINSCCEKLISVDKNFATKDNKYKLFTHIYQLVIFDNYNDAKKQIKKLRQLKNRIMMDDSHLEVLEFYDLFLSRDKVGLENLLLSMATNIERRFGWGEELFKLMTLLSYDLRLVNPMDYAKLCWLKGIEVEINHPGIPMELLPISPLPQYFDEYDFLSPKWKPPQMGVIAELKRWYQVIRSL